MEESLFSLQSLLISNSRELSSETSNWYRKMSRQAMFSFAQYHGKELRPGTKVVGGRKWRQEKGFLVKPSFDMKGNQLGAKEEDLRWMEEKKKSPFQETNNGSFTAKDQIHHLAVCLLFVVSYAQLWGQKLILYFVIVSTCYRTLWWVSRRQCQAGLLFQAASKEISIAAFASTMPVIGHNVEQYFAANFPYYRLFYHQEAFPRRK